MSSGRLSEYDYLVGRCMVCTAAVFDYEQVVNADDFIRLT